MTSADAFDVLYEWAKDRHNVTLEDYASATKENVKDFHVGRIDVWKLLVEQLEEIRAEGFTDAEELARLRAHITKQVELIDKANVEYGELIERQRKAIDAQQTIIANYEAMFEGGNSQAQ